MKPSERITQIAQEMMNESSSYFYPRECPTAAEYVFAIMEYLDDEDRLGSSVKRRIGKVGRGK